MWKLKRSENESVEDKLMKGLINGSIECTESSVKTWSWKIIEEAAKSGNSPFAKSSRKAILKRNLKKL